MSDQSPSAPASNSSTPSSTLPPNPETSGGQSTTPPAGPPKKSKLMWFVLLALVVVLAVLAAVYYWPKPKPKPAVTPRTVKLGFMSPLSGDDSNFGLLYQQGVQMAQKDFNQEGLTFDITYKNTHCSPDEAAATMKEFVETDHFPVVFGEVCSGATLAALPLANSSHTVLISALSSSPKLSQPDYFFRTYPTDKPQATYTSNLMKKRNVKRLALITSNEAYGLALDEDVAAEFKKTGGTVAADEVFDTKATANIDFKAQLTRIKAANPDAIYLGTNSPVAGAAIIVQARQMGINVQVYGSDALKSLSFASDLGTAGEGMLVTAVTEGTDKFNDKYRAKYGSLPVSAGAAQGYDAFMIIAKAIANGATTGEQIKNAIAHTNFDGASGHVEFDANGDVIGSSYKLYTIKDKKFVLTAE